MVGLEKQNLKSQELRRLQWKVEIDLFPCQFGPVTLVLSGRLRILACLVTLWMLCTHQCKSIAPLESECWSHNQAVPETAQSKSLTFVHPFLFQWNLLTASSLTHVEKVASWRSVLFL